MRKLPLIGLIFSLCILQIFAQTKKATKTNVKKVIPTKTTASPTPVPVSSPKTVPTAVAPAATIKLTAIEAEVLAEINRVRTNPSEYVKQLESYLKTFNGKDATTPDGREIVTNEGKIPVEEVISILKQTQPLPEFKLADGLTNAARDHAQDLVKNNKSGHRGSDGSMPDERIAKYGISNVVNENISYFTKTAKAVVLTMLIDDGTASRNHRKNLLSKDLKVIGVAMGENKSVGSFCVIVFANSFVDKKGGIRSF